MLSKVIEKATDHFSYQYPTNQRDELRQGERDDMTHYNSDGPLNRFDFRDVQIGGKESSGYFANYLSRVALFR